MTDTRKVHTLCGVDLILAVAAAENKIDYCEVHAGNVYYGNVSSGFISYDPTTDWKQAGAIIEREHISLEVKSDGVWLAYICYNYGDTNTFMHGDSNPLAAAMRCYVESKLGKNVPCDIHSKFGVGVGK